MTIEEKAKDYAERNYSPSFPYDALKLAYIEGATEQREIDIEEACEWLKEQFPNTHEETNLIDEFVKAMEGE